jgi:hypothetical protein
VERRGKILDSPSRRTGKTADDLGVAANDASGRQGAIARLILAVVAVAFGGGIFYVTSALGLGWRIGLAVLVAAPILLLVDLLRAAPGVSPRPGPPPRRRSPRAD